MANEMTMDVVLNPVLNTQQFNAEVSKLEKQLRSMKSGRHATTAALGSRLIQSLVESGQAATATQARIILSDFMGGGFSNLAKANLRTAQNQAQLTINRQKQQNALQLKQAQIGLSQESKARMSTLGFLGRQWAVQNQYRAVEKEPDKEGATYLLGNIVSLRRDLLKLYLEYRVNRRQIPPLLRQIAQNTSTLRREVSDWSDTKDEKSAGSNMIMGLTKKLLGAAALSTIYKKSTEAIKAALDRGMQAIYLKAAYGNDVNWADVRARAGIYNMSVEAAASTSQYASDFRQRMMWGEISEREIVGLSRAGKWGRMVMSGEAARNPAAANQAFEEMVATTDQAKMRSILRQLGLSQELMNYNIQGYDQGTRAEFFDKFGEIAEKEWQAAVLMYDAGNQYQAYAEQISETMAMIAGVGVANISPQGRAFAERMGVGLQGLSDRNLEGANPFVKNIVQQNQGSWVNWGGPSDLVKQINVVNNNTYNVEGNLDRDAVNDIDRINRETAVAQYTQMAQSLGSRTRP